MDISGIAKKVYGQIGPEIRFDEKRGILQIEDSYFLTRITEAYHVIKRASAGKDYSIEIVPKLTIPFKETASEEGSLEGALIVAETLCEGLAGFKVNAYR